VVIARGIKTVEQHAVGLQLTDHAGQRIILGSVHARDLVALVAEDCLDDFGNVPVVIDAQDAGTLRSRHMGPPAL
jgi:hypothetical protein